MENTILQRRCENCSHDVFNKRLGRQECDITRSIIEKDFCCDRFHEDRFERDRKILTTLAEDLILNGNENTIKAGYVLRLWCEIITEVVYGIKSDGLKNSKGTVSYIESMFLGQDEE